MALKSLKDFFIKFVSVVDSGDNPKANVKMFKSKGGADMSKTIKDILGELSEEDVKVLQPELGKVKDMEKKIGELEKSNKDFEDKINELEKANPDKEKKEDKDDLIKDADPKIQEMIKKTQDENKEIKKQLEDMEKARKEDGEKLRKEQLSKEADNYGNIGATKEDLVEIFTKIDQTGDEEFMAKVKAILSADNKALKGNILTKAIGSSSDEEASAEDRLEKKAKDLMEKDKKLTIEQAKVKVMKNDPKLTKELYE